MPEIPGGKFKKIREKKATEERRKANIAYNRTRTDKDLVSLYGTQRWKKLRRMKLHQDPLCEICKKEGKIVAAELVHHIAEAKDNPEMFFNMNNLQCLCESCHNRIHRG
jgi:5-methylcytosine-specific restriction protein A